MKIKLIDLLNKIAEGKELPKKIKCYGKIFQLEENGSYYCYDNDFQNDWVSNLLSNELTLSTNELNDYLEIIEEPKKIEKIEQALDEIANICNSIPKEDSICTSCLMALFSQLLDISWEDKLWNIKNSTKTGNI